MNILTYSELLNIVESFVATAIRRVCTFDSLSHRFKVILTLTTWLLSCVDGTEYQQYYSGYIPSYSESYKATKSLDPRYIHRSSLINDVCNRFQANPTLTTWLLNCVHLTGISARIFCLIPTYSES
eukprot:m.257422 g.257422  ORF g.257422 m.257422 type:complete len:126 (+) comp17583_c1_seq15:5577-5954(+)